MRNQKTVTVSISVFAATIKLPDGESRTIQCDIGSGEATLAGFLLAFPGAIVESKTSGKQRYKLNIADIAKYGTLIKEETTNG